LEPLAAGDPRQIGPYRLQARLGAGGMGRVYLAFSPTGQPVAMKVIHPELAADPQFRVRFRREVAAASTVSSAYTAPVVEAAPDADPPWLATALVPGPSLAEAVTARGPLPGPAVWRLAAGLAEALLAIHSCGLVHRDLKPANVLLAPAGPLVIDFGISRALEGTVMTATGLVVGTPAFMSPEQAMGDPVTPASDVFSLGCLIAFAATGSGPFGDGQPAPVLYRVVHIEPVLDGVPSGLRELAAACLIKHPGYRPALPALIQAIRADSAPQVASLASFWPDAVAGLIRAHQASMGIASDGAAPDSAEPEPAAEAEGVFDRAASDGAAPDSGEPEAAAEAEGVFDRAAPEGAAPDEAEFDRAARRGPAGPR
jgi:serine/threonine protein kinase